MKTAFLAACGAAALATSAFAETLSIEDYAGRIQVETGDYPALAVEVLPGESGAAPVVSRDADGVTVLGDWNPEGFWASTDGDGQCRGDGAQREIRLEGGGRYYRQSELPLIRVTAPRGLDLDIEDSLIAGEAGDLGAASIGLAGCSVLDVASVAGAMDVDLIGVGNLRVGDIGGLLDADIAGAGEMDIGAVDGGADIDIAGAGEMQIAQISGSVDADLAGAGNLTILDGDLDHFELDVAGIGDVRFGGSARMARVNVFGLGDVEIAHADDADVNVGGMADVRVNGRRAR